MSSQTRYPTATEADPDWVNPLHANVDDNSPASVSTTGASTGHMELSYFLFSIPAGATIDGVEVTFKDFSLNGIIAYNFIKLVVDSVVSGSNLAASEITIPVGPSYTYQVVGGPTELWGNSLTPALINANDFGVYFILGAVAEDTAYLDAVSITVFYTPAGGSPTSQTLAWLLIDEDQQP